MNIGQESPWQRGQKCKGPEVAASVLRRPGHREDQEKSPGR